MKERDKKEAIKPKERPLLQEQPLNWADEDAKADEDYYNSLPTTNFAAARVAEVTEELVMGRNAVMAALDAKRTCNKAWLLKSDPAKGRDRRLQQLEKYLHQVGVPILYVERKALDRIAQSDMHQGVLLQVAPHAYVDASEHLASLQASGKKPFVLLLDGVQDGRNLGAILRVADATGVDLVVVPERRSVVVDCYVSRASAGAAEHVAIARVTNLTKFTLDLKKQGFWIYGTDAEAAVEFHDSDLKGSIALVIGSEGRGIAPKLRGHCDFLLSIPMQGAINSLNAAVACGIICVEAARQRK